MFDTSFRDLIKIICSRLKKIDRSILSGFIIIFILTLIISWGLVSKIGIPRGHDVGIWLLASYDAKHDAWSFIWDDARFPGMPRNPTRCTPLYLIVTLLTKVVGEITLILVGLEFMLFFITLSSMFYFTYYYTKSVVAGLASALIYTFNRISPILGGPGYMLGYALTPLLFLSLDKALRGKSFRNTLIFSLLLSLLVTSTILAHAYVVLLFTAIYVLLHLVIRMRIIGRVRTMTSKEFLGYIAHGSRALFIPAIIVFLLSAFYLVPLISVTGPIIAKSGGYSVENIIKFSSGSLLNSIILKPTTRPTEYVNVLYIDFITMIIVIISLSVLLYHRDFYSTVFSLFIMFSAFFSCGPNPPFKEIYLFLYNNLPYFSFVRSARRWMMITLFAYSFLVGIAVGDSISYLKRALKTPSKISYKNMRILSKLFMIMLLFSSIITFSILHGIEQKQWMKTYNLPESYVKPYEWIRQQSGDFVIATTPFLMDRVWTNWSLWAIDFGKTFGPAYTGKTALGGFWIGGVRVNEQARDLLSDFKKNMIPVTYRYDTYDVNNSEQIIVDKKWDNFVMNVKVKLIEVFDRDNYASVLIRFRDYNNHYLVTLSESSEEVMFIKMCDGETNLIASATMKVELNTWHELKIITYGPYFRVYVNNILKIDAIDYSFARGEAILKSSHAIFSEIQATLIPENLNLNSMKLLSLFGVKYVILQEYSNEWEKLIFLIQKGFTRTYEYNEAIIGKNDYYFPRLYVPRNTALVVGSPEVLGNLLEIDMFRFNNTLLFFTTDLSNDDIAGILSHSNFIVYQSGPNQSILERVKEYMASVSSDSSLIPICILNKDSFVTNTSILEKGGATLQTSKTEISILRSGYYKMAVLGIVEDLMNASLTINSINNVASHMNVKLTSYTNPQYKYTNMFLDDLLNFTWLISDYVYLNNGSYNITLDLEANGILIHSALLYSDPEGTFLTPDDLLSVGNKPPILNYTKISPIEYVINVKLEDPNFLVFIENFNPLWKARLTSGEINSYIAYHFTNAFYISSPGDYKITIYFEGQKYAYFGQFVTLISWSISVLFLIVWPKWNRFRIRHRHVENIS